MVLSRRIKLKLHQGDGEYQSRFVAMLNDQGENRWVTESAPSTTVTWAVQVDRLG